MNIKELHSFKLSDAVKMHDKLNPKLWVGYHLKLRVRTALMNIAKDFAEYLGLDNSMIRDVTISGSNAAYSYTDMSDIDLHIIVDYSKLENDEVYRELFDSKKTLYNDYNKIKIFNIDVECYVQDSSTPAITLGEYSLIKNDWIKLPSKRRANLDHTTTKLKYEKLGNLIKHALKSYDYDMISKVLYKIRKYRQSGLEKGGEFSPENLSYKLARNSGLLDKLYSHRNAVHSRKLSIENKDTVVY